MRTPWKLRPCSLRKKTSSRGASVSSVTGSNGERMRPKWIASSKSDSGVLVSRASRTSTSLDLPQPAHTRTGSAARAALMRCVRCFCAFFGSASRDRLMALLRRTVTVSSGRLSSAP